MKGLSDNVPWTQHGEAPKDWRSLIRYTGILVLALAAIFYIHNAIVDVFQWRSQFNRLGDHSISLDELEYGRWRCSQDQQRPVVDYGLVRKRLASLSKDTISNRVILQNTTIIDGDGTTSANMTIVLRGGIIEQVRNSSEFIDEFSNDDVIMDAAGRYISPGLIEMHSHVGVRSLPQLWGSEDVTETSAPVTPWARAIDGYKSNDQAIDLVASGGVTTSLVLTGAQNIISGEGYVFKMKRDDSPYSMLVNTSSDTGGKPQRYLKAALGENVKKTFQNRPGGPVTREGVSYHFRHALEAAQHLKQRQDGWCDSMKDKNAHKRPVHDLYPESLELQTLVDLLRGDIRLNVHCYETEDVYSLFDHSDEFGFNISAVHHALASHLMIDELKRRQVAVATFADEWGFKPEIYDTSFYLSKYLVDAGIPLALTTDHPAGYGKLLTYQAQVAYHYGVDADHAMASLTGVPAKFLGLDNRVGYIRPGFDADLVLWNKHPLQLGATPLLVSIDGDIVINATESLWNDIRPDNDQSKGPPPQRTQKQNDPSICSPGQNDLVVQGITSDFFNDQNPDMDGNQDTNVTGTAVIRNGELVCVGKHRCHTLAQSLVKEKHIPVLNVTDGYVLPGLTVLTRQYGLGEIPYEDSTMDGKHAGEDLDHFAFTRHGLRFGEQHLERCHRKGVTRLITPPMTDGFFHGMSAGFRTGASSVLDFNAVPCPDCALHFTIGHEAKTKTIPTVSQQLQLLEEILTVKSTSRPEYERAAKGQLPVVVTTDHKDIIAQLIQLKQKTGANIIIMGGAEAHLVARELAEIEMPVILWPGICLPLTWDQRRCLVGPPLTPLSNAEVLLQAGVLVGLGNWDYRQRHAEDALWEAGWALGAADKHREALDMVSRNIDKMFGLRGSMEDVVIYEGNPFEFGASVAVVLEAGGIQRCWPEIEPPRLGYQYGGWEV